MSQRRIELPESAANELRQRHAMAQQAQQQFEAYLRGLCGALDVPLDERLGVDVAGGALLVTEPEPAEDAA